MFVLTPKFEVLDNKYGLNPCVCCVLYKASSNLAIETLSKDSITTTGYVLTHYFKEASKLLNIVIFRTTLECDAMSQKSWYKLLQLPSNIFPKKNIEIICISTNGVNVSIVINEEGELSVYPRGNILKNDVVTFNVVYTI